jgi:hypothetical protein
MDIGDLNHSQRRLEGPVLSRVEGAVPSEREAHLLDPVLGALI